METLWLAVATYGRYFSALIQTSLFESGPAEVQRNMAGRRLVVVGLGNFGSPRQRHSVGALILHELAKKKGLSWETVNKDMKVAENDYLVLVEPRTFMNESGRGALAAKRYGKVEDLVVVHDDLERALGKVSVKRGGSANGHNGIRSIIDTLGTQDFHRIRVGIGRPESRGSIVSRFVLETFSPEEIDKIPFEHVLKLLEAMMPERDLGSRRTN